MGQPHEPMTNRGCQLVPKTSFRPPVLSFDFPAVKVGIAEYEAGPTGCTVFYFPHGVQAAVDIRGGSPATIHTDHQGLRAGDRLLHAICFAGGSKFGLEAVTGVTEELFWMHGLPRDKRDIPKVAGAAIYDFNSRKNRIHPDKELGRAAVRAAQTGVFPLGNQGAGRSAAVGKGMRPLEWESGGQGGAFREVGPTKIAVFAVVNAVGSIVDRSGNVVRGHYNRQENRRENISKRIRDGWFPASSRRSENTTLTLAVTNQKLTASELRQLAIQIHTSMARAIHPFHTLDDGDVLFMATTNEVENRTLSAMALGLIASELAWDAVLNSIPAD